MTNQVKNRFGLVLLILFCIVTALGSFNPFGSYNINDMNNSSSPFSLLVQGAFILYLAFYPGHNAFLKSEIKIISIFIFLWTISTIIYARAIPNSFWMNDLKLILCVILFYKLPFFLRDNPRFFDVALLVFALASAIIALLFWLGYLNAYVQWHNGRVFLFGENPNAMSTRMCFAMLFLMYILLENPFRLRPWRFILFVLFIPLLFLIMASGSRGSFIVLILCSAGYMLFLPANNKLVKYLILIVGCLGMFYAISQISADNDDFVMLERVTDSIETGNDSGRTRLSAAALDIFKNYPFLGVGAVEFSRMMLYNYGLNHTVHNNYWYVLATSGIIGFLFYALFLAKMTLKAFYNRKDAPFAFICIVGMLLIGSKSGGALAYMPLWFVFALSCGLLLIKRKL